MLIFSLKKKNELILETYKLQNDEKIKFDELKDILNAKLFEKHVLSNRRGKSILLTKNLRRKTLKYKNEKILQENESKRKNSFDFKNDLENNTNNFSEKKNKIKDNSKLKHSKFLFDKNKKSFILEEENPDSEKSRTESENSSKFSYDSSDIKIKRISTFSEENSIEESGKYDFKVMKNSSNDLIRKKKGSNKFLSSEKQFFKANNFFSTDVQKEIKKDIFLKTEKSLENISIEKNLKFFKKEDSTIFSDKSHFNIKNLMVNSNENLFEERIPDVSNINENDHSLNGLQFYQNNKNKL